MAACAADPAGAIAWHAITNTQRKSPPHTRGDVVEFVACLAACIHVDIEALIKCDVVIAMDLGVDEGDGCGIDCNTSTINSGIRVNFAILKLDREHTYYVKCNVCIDEHTSSISLERLIVVDLGVGEGDSSSPDGNTTSL